MQLGFWNQSSCEGWTLFFAGVVPRDRRRAGVGLLMAPQFSARALEFTPVDERGCGRMPSAAYRCYLCFLQITRYCWPRTLTSRSHLDGLKPSVKYKGDDQHFLIWGNGSQPEKGEFPTPHWGRVTSPSGGGQVFLSLDHKWGENGAGDWQTNWGSVGSDAVAEAVSCGEERAELKGEALNLQVNPLSNSQLWSWALGS